MMGRPNQEPTTGLLGGSFPRRPVSFDMEGVMTGSEYLAMLIKHGTEWVKQLREQHRPLGQMLPAEARVALVPFFEERILDKARFSVMPVIPNPPFYSLLPAGVPVPIDFTIMAGLTVGVTVLLAETRIDPNLS